jgi:hypothetical protein
MVTDENGGQLFGQLLDVTEEFCGATLDDRDN